MNIWRLHSKPDPEKGISRRDVLEFCMSQNIIGVGWTEIDTRTGDYDDIHKQAYEKYQDHPTSCVKAINAMNSMQTEDLIWTRLEGIYYICKVGEKLWVDSTPSSEHYRYDVSNYIEVEWIKIGTEEKVPGKVVSCFRSSSTVQRVSDVEIISKYIWNKHKTSSKEYDIEKLESDSIWNLLTSEMVEEIFLLFLQIEKKYIIYTSTIKSSTSKIECVLVSSDGDHRCYPQVKTGKVALNSDHFIELLDNKKDRVYLFATSQNYIENDCQQIETIKLDVIENFIKTNNKLLPENIRIWLELFE